MARAYLFWTVLDSSATGAATMPVMFEGATLLVIYKNPGTASSRVYLYDDPSGTAFAASFAATLAHPVASGPGLFTMTGAGGQRGSGRTAKEALTWVLARA
ncbi:MAG: hypothetical protein HY899_02770 [Deltaproteobacteria bacterium]|nr:hypothetical protein [Deltaproteobacteria bacterium]